MSNLTQTRKAEIKSVQEISTRDIAKAREYWEKINIIV